MRIIRSFLIVTAFSVVWGQTPAALAPRGTPMKAAAEEYDFSGDSGKVRIGAAYMGRSFAGPENKTEEKQRTAMYDAGNFLVVEVAVFAGRGFDGEVHAEDFALRLEPQGKILKPLAPGLVANYLKGRGAELRQRQMGYGGGFPGDPSQTPAQDSARQEWDSAIESSIPEGKLASGRAGNLFFDFPGKLTKVKSMILDYQGDGGRLELKLR